VRRFFRNNSDLELDPDTLIPKLVFEDSKLSLYRLNEGGRSKLKKGSEMSAFFLIKSNSSHFSSFFLIIASSAFPSSREDSSHL